MTDTERIFLCNILGKDPNGIKNAKRGDILIYYGDSRSNKFTEGKEYKIINEPFLNDAGKVIFRIKNDSGNSYKPLAKHFVLK